ncbi:LegC family aminotransferase [Pseudomonadota bacterium]|nr:LegC family aminotransferase [Pseudomonadota bacterium]
MSNTKVKELTDNIIAVIKKTIKLDSANLHEPQICENDIKSVVKNLKSSFVSSVGEEINDFEKAICQYTGSSYAIATCNGTSALHTCLLVNKIKTKDEVLVPSLTFVATANAIKYCGSIPHFVDTEMNSFGIDVDKLEIYLKKNTKIENNECINLKTGRRIHAIIPVHIFGFIGDIIRLKKLALQYNLIVIEDAAEALGSFKKGKHAGTFGKCSSLSFNGNKIITTGAGGALITNDIKIAKYARHITTTAKLKHNFKYIHDMVGYNYRMPALNAALGNSQLKKLPKYLIEKQKLQNNYRINFEKVKDVVFFSGPSDCDGNNWLNTIILSKKISKYRDIIVQDLINHGYECRPTWELLSSLKPFKNSPSMDLTQAKILQKSVINIPSSPFLGRIL